MPVILIAFGLGTVYGITLCGGMRAANRQARSGRYRPLPSGNRRVTPARPLLDEGGITWRTIPAISASSTPARNKL